MARVSPVAPLPLSPFWQLPAFRLGVLAIFAILLLLGIGWMEKLNRSYQIERRLGEDARLAPMVHKIKQQIETAGKSGILENAAQAAQGQVPQALWLGRVAEVDENATGDGSIVVLSDAHLLAGRPGPHDRGGQVRVGRRRYVYSGTRPKVGENWLISVWRDGSSNAIHSAARYTSAP